MNGDPIILILDDDSTYLSTMREMLLDRGFQVITCATVKEATQAMAQKPNAALVDLYLSGDEGDELSNNFIRDVLIPAGVPYIRVTSAPSSVPQQFAGLGVLNKRDLFYDDERFMFDLERLLNP